MRYVAAAACQTDLPNPLDRAQMREQHRPHALDDRRRPSPAARRSCRCGWSCSRSSRTPRPSFPPSRSCSTSWPCRSRTSTPTASHARRASTASTSRAARCWRRIRAGPASSSTRRASSARTGILYKYRKVNPWIPYEVHASPHDLDRLRRAALPGRRHADRPHRLRDLLRLAVSRGDPPARRQRRRGAAARLGLHGPLGRDRADELVDDREPLPRAREHRLRRRREPGREPAALSAVLVAGRQPGRRLRRPHARPGLAGPGRAHRRRADRHHRAPARARDAARPHMLAHLRTEAYPVYARTSTRRSARRAPARRPASAIWN